jgi:sterol desaturase/sphingolipid hydroxylase (fatty acid hydroxylase superfamily)
VRRHSLGWGWVLWGRAYLKSNPCCPPLIHVAPLFPTIHSHHKWGTQQIQKWEKHLPMEVVVLCWGTLGALFFQAFLWDKHLAMGPVPTFCGVRPGPLSLGMWINWHCDIFLIFFLFYLAC